MKTAKGIFRFIKKTILGGMVFLVPVAVLVVVLTRADRRRNWLI